MDELNNTFEFHITKAALGDDGKMVWASTASDIYPDVFNEKMSLELYNSFIANYKAGTPERIFVSLSHYPEYNGLGNCGEVTHLYMDGDKLKAKGIFYDNPLGKAIFNAIRKDRNDKLPNEKRVRVSIGFYATKMRVGDKIWRYGDNTELPVAKNGEIRVYEAGILEHLAVTRKPANRRANINIIETEKTEKSEMTNARKDDALSIVGDNPEAVEIVNQLEAKTQIAPVEKMDTPPVVQKDDSVFDPASVEVVVGLDLGALKEKLGKFILSMLPDGTLTDDELSNKVNALLGNISTKSETPQITENVPEVQKDMGDMGGMSEDTPSENDTEDAWLPLGGAKSIGDALKFMELEKLEDKLEQAFYIFGAISNNIMNCDDDIMVRMKNMGQLFTDFKGMLRPDTLLKLAEFEKSPMTVSVSKSESEEIVVTGEMVQPAFYQPIVDKVSGVLSELSNSPMAQRREKLGALMNELAVDLQGYDAEVEKRLVEKSGIQATDNTQPQVTMDTLQQLIEQINGSVDNKLAAYNQGLTSQIAQLTELVQQSIVARSTVVQTPAPIVNNQPIPQPLPVQKSVTYAPHIPQDDGRQAGKPMSIRDFARKSVFLG